MADLQHNPSSSGANEENPIINGSGAALQSGGNTAGGGLGGDVGGPPGIYGGVESGIHAPPVPRKDKNLREFLAAMDEFAPIVGFPFQLW